MLVYLESITRSVLLIKLIPVFLVRDDDINTIAKILHQNTVAGDREKLYGELGLLLCDLDDLRKNHGSSGFTFYRETLRLWRTAEARSANPHNLCVKLKKLNINGAAGYRLI